MDMKSMTWLKPGLYGAVLGAIALAIFGFQWGGWVTGATARSMAASQARVAVVDVLTPLCLEQAKRDPEFAAKLIELKKATSYGRSDLVVKAGWGAVLGSTETNDLINRSCADKLVL